MRMWQTSINDMTAWVKAYYRENALISYLHSHFGQVQQSAGIAKCLCPWRVDKNIGSFAIWLNNGNWHDFATAEHGDIISFHQRAFNLDFKGALRDLAQKAGLI